MNIYFKCFPQPCYAKPNIDEHINTLQTFASPRLFLGLPSCPSPFDLRPFLPVASFSNWLGSCEDDKGTGRGPWEWARHGNRLNEGLTLPRLQPSWKQVCVCCSCKQTQRTNVAVKDVVCESGRTKHRVLVPFMETKTLLQLESNVYSTWN